MKKTMLKNMFLYSFNILIIYFYDYSWGVLKNIVEIINKQNDGTYILMKSLASQKPIIKLFKLPVDANIDEEEEDF